MFGRARQVSTIGYRYLSMRSINAGDALKEKKRAVSLKVYSGGKNDMDCHFPFNYAARWASGPTRRHLVSEFIGARDLENFLETTFDEVKLVDIVIEQRQAENKRIAASYDQPPRAFPNPQAVQAAQSILKRIEKVQGEVSHKLSAEDVCRVLKSSLPTLLGKGPDADNLVRCFALGLLRTNTNTLGKELLLGRVKASWHITKSTLSHIFMKKEVPRARLRALADPFFEATTVNMLQHELVNRHYPALALEVRETGQQVKKIFEKTDDIDEELRVTLREGLRLFAKDVISEVEGKTRFHNYPLTPMFGIFRTGLLAEQMKVDKIAGAALAPSEPLTAAVEVRESYSKIFGFPSDKCDPLHEFAGEPRTTIEKADKITELLK